MAKKKGKKQAKKKPAKKRKPSEPVIVPERVLAGLTGKEEVVGTELLELGGGPFSGVRSKRACVARGAIWRKPPPGSRLPGVCAKRPGLTGCDGAGGFISKVGKCPPGLVKIRTVHPRFKTGVFHMCVLPSTAPKVRGRAALFAPPGRLFASGLGEFRLLPDEISFPMLLVGDLVGLGTGKAVARLLPAAVGETTTDIIKVVLGGGSAALYMGVRKSLPLGLALGLLPSAIDGAIDLITRLVPAGRPALGTPALTGGKLGQLEPEQLRELREIAEELTGPGVGQADEDEDEDEEEVILEEEPPLLGQAPEEIEAEPVTSSVPFRSLTR